MYSFNGIDHVGPGLQVLGLQLQVQCIGNQSEPCILFKYLLLLFFKRMRC